MYYFFIASDLNVYHFYSEEHLLEREKNILPQYFWSFHFNLSNYIKFINLVSNIVFLMSPSVIFYIEKDWESLPQ